MLPVVSTGAMTLFLGHFAATLAEDEHAVMALDGAGWHASHRLAVPANMTLLRLPPYSPELNPVERVWLHLPDRYLSHRILDGYTAIIGALCDAWRKLTPNRLHSLCNYPWIREVCRATIRVRTPDNQGEKVVARLVS